MRHNQFVRPPASLQARAAALLVDVLGLTPHGSRLPANLLARVLLWVGLTRATFTAAAARLRLGVSDTTLRLALKDHLPNSDETLSRLIRVSLDAKTLKWLRKRKKGLVLAVDLQLQPYYGRSRDGVVKGQAKQGTKRFWALATISVVRGGQPLTLAFAPVQSNRMEEALEALWPQLEALGCRCRRLLLDRGFYGAPVVRWLQNRHIPFLMPMIRRGKPPRRGRAGTGTAPFFARGRRGFARHTWRQRRRGETVDVGVVMVPPKDRRRRPLVFIYEGRLPNLGHARDVYRKRFGIETTYRVSHRTRGWTTSGDQRWRRLLQVLSFILENLWIQLACPSRPTGRRRYAISCEAFIETLLRKLDLTPSDPLEDKRLMRRWQTSIY